MLDRLGNEMETIQEGVQGLVVMEDSLKGEGETLVHYRLGSRNCKQEARLIFFSLMFERM
ncbi:hypothetical protein MKX62_03950 [Sporosarcina sp. FSL K6-5500]